MDREQNSLVKWIAGLGALVGLWLIISPFALSLSSASSYWNDIVIGVVALVLGLSQLSASETPWPSWVNLIAAIWLILSPYLFNPIESSAYTNAVVSGLILGILALADGLIIQSTHSPAVGHRT